MARIIIRTFLQIAGLAAAPDAGRVRQEGTGSHNRASPRRCACGPGCRQGLASRHRRRLTRLSKGQNEKGEIVGFDVEVVQAVAQKAGIEVKFVNTPWEGIFNALAAGDRDMVVSAVTITEERKGTMDFSDPYFDAQQLIAVKDNSKIAKFADLKKLKVGVQTGTTGDEAVTKLLGKTSPDIKRFESTPLARKELEAAASDAVVATTRHHPLVSNTRAASSDRRRQVFAPSSTASARKGKHHLQAS